MILQALAAYYEKLAEMGKATRPGWCTAKVCLLYTSRCV